MNDHSLMEVELRTFISENSYKELLGYFKTQGCDVRAVRQITHYLEAPIDTRILISQQVGKMWQKMGRMHDVARPEVEANISREAATQILQIMGNLGISSRVTWYRERSKFIFDSIEVCLDHTVGYGWIFEVEVKCADADVAANKSKLVHLLQQLGLSEGSRQEFDLAFKEYLETWQLRTAGISEAWLDEVKA